MPSINRSTYLTPVQRFAQPGGYDRGPHGTIVEFDNISGLQRRRGKRPLYEDMVRQGCQPTGRRTGPPGFESDEYNCPFPTAGSPAWFQGRKPKRTTVFEGLGSGAFTALVVPAAVVVAIGAVVYYGLSQVADAHQARELERLRGRTF